MVFDIIKASWQTITELAPYLLLGLFIAGVLSVYVSPETVERHLGRGRFASIFKASLFGVPLPLCSCSVVPVAAALRKHGASRGATTAFLVSTPETGVDSMAVTYSLLGPFFALYRAFAAFFMGLLSGVAVDFAERSGGPEPEPSAEPESSCCEPRAMRNRFYAIVHHGFVILPRDLANALFVGIVLASLVAVWVPADALGEVMGSGFRAKVVMLLVGIPVYVCATASVPIAAALIGAGLSPGGALVFLMAGPATNAATLGMVWKIVGRGASVIFLSVIAVSSLVSGVALDWWYAGDFLTRTAAGHEMFPGWFKQSCAVLLIGVFVGAKIKRRS